MEQFKNAQKIVDEIIRELPPSLYTIRFREELLEHIKDAEEDLQDKENSINQIKTKVMQKIGDKDTLTKSYIDFHRSRLSSLWPIELLVYIALSFYVFLITSTIMTPYNLITDSSFWILKLVVIAISILVGYALNRTLFSFIAKRLSLHASGKKGRILIALSLVILPTLFVLSNLLDVLKSDMQGSYLYEYLSALFLTFAVIYIADGAAFGILSRKGKKVSRGNTETPYLFLFAVLAIMLGSILLVAQKTDASSALGQFSNVMAAFLAIPMGIIYYPLNIFTRFDPATTFRVFVILLIAMALLGIWLFISAAKTKTASSKNWKRAIGIALAAYSIYVLLPVNRVQEKKINWNIPAMEVNKKIEQDQYGLLYSAQEYASQAGGYLGSYMICREGNLFTVVQSSNAASNYFLIDVNSIPMGQSPAISIKANKSLGECIEELSLSDGTIPRGFECPDCIKDMKYDDSGNTTSYTTDYTNLTYNGHKIFNNEGLAPNVSEIKVSDNQEWALFEIDLNKVYLADLREVR